MTSLRSKILTKRCLGAKTALLLWPLVLYSLIQIVTDSTHEDNSSSLGEPQNLQDCTVKLAASSRVIELQDVYNSEARLQDKQPCSSRSKISFPQSSSHQARPAYLPSSLLLLKQIFTGRRSLFGGKILLAEASSLYELNQDKEIIILNSTNFNSELIQHKHQFPHIKLIEYYVSFCGFCAKFKATYLKLAKEINSWRNVMRPSAIDLGVSSNSPIAHSWSVEVVPTLRIHPPPNPTLAEKLDKQLSALSSKLSPSDLQRSMFNEYNASSLMIHSLSVEQYMDKVNLLKADLLNYIERYVRDSSNQLPASWPNLRPVTESSLLELRRNHPRQELFLLIEGTSSTSSSGSADQSSSGEPSLALSIMMELSSSGPWKAIRYVRASENKALIQDVIAQQKRVSEQQQQQQLDNSITEQVELLNNLLSNQNLNGNNILLIHIDDSHSSVRSGGYSSAYPYMTIVTGTDLETMEQSVLIENHSSFINRARREVNLKRREPRSLFDSSASSINKMTNERKIDLLTLYIKQTYTETKEDRDFVQAINNLSDSSKSETPSEELSKTPERYIRTQNSTKNSEQQNTDVEQKFELQQQSLLTKIYNLFNPSEKKQNILQSSYSSFSTDYDDKLKAIRHMLFNEIPRTIFIDKSLYEQQEKLNTLVNLVTVIKAYFPLPDSASIQFIDGVQSYLIKQQKRLSAISNPERGITNFDTRAFKQELKRLESEDKRLPEIKEWKHCKNSGYPCAIWRLFHTLVAFEYKKLSQMRQSSLPPSPSLAQSPKISQHQQDNINLSSAVEAITMKSANSNGLQSPIERLVSPPSTTTSLSLTIATPSQALDGGGGNDNNIIKKPLTEADLPTPVLLVMRDYITTFFSCEECKRKFRAETAELNLEKIRQEPAEFSILWLWETHNRVNKRLSVEPDQNPQDHPKVWFPTYGQCSKCYKKPPSFLQDSTVDPVTIFHESIEWNKQEVLCYLVREFTRQPMDNQTNIFGYQVPFGFGYIIITCICCLVLAAVFRCTSLYIERQRRHKATLLNGNDAHYTLELN